MSYPGLKFLSYVNSTFQIALGQNAPVSTQQTQNMCITFVQCWPYVSDVGPALYKSYAPVLCLIGIFIHLPLQDDVTPLDEYVWRDDGYFSYFEKDVFYEDGVTIYAYNMTSQIWMTGQYSIQVHILSLNGKKQ